MDNGREDPVYRKQAKDYQDAIDFAFFVVNFGYSKADYEALTPADKLFIRKSYEDKTVSDSSLFQSAVETAVANCLRKKGKRPLKLWKKKQKKANIPVVKKQMDTVKRIEEKEGKGWVAEIYKAAGLPMPERRK